ncbi:MAG TPA: nuclear transport factor 2 family protein [Polyangiaceae bacterium]|nr:nuclear transport factor 2 family protein [Polyangiaceae bacterium]
MALQGVMTSTLRSRLTEALVAVDLHDLAPFLAEVRALYADDVVFRDPMQSSRGLEAFLEVNRRLARMARTLRFDVTDATGDDELFYLHWTLHLTPRVGPSLKVEGVSRLRARDGRVFEHVDYWDLGELFASPVGGQRLLHALFRPFV